MRPSVCQKDGEPLGASGSGARRASWRHLPPASVVQYLRVVPQTPPRPDTRPVACPGERGVAPDRGCSPPSTICTAKDDGIWYKPLLLTS